MIIGLTGLARSGKDAAAKYLIDNYKFNHLDFARDALFAEADKRGLERDKMILSILGDELRQEGGRGVLAKIINAKIEYEEQSSSNLKTKSSKPEKNYVITGFRSPEEVDLIRNEHLDFVLIEVNADKLTRFSRRNEKDPQDLEGFSARDQRDIYNKGLGEVLKMADYKINNEGTIEELFKLTGELMVKIKEEFKWITFILSVKKCEVKWITKNLD